MVVQMRLRVKMCVHFHQHDRAINYAVYFCSAQNIQMLLVFNGENTHCLTMFNYSGVFVHNIVQRLQY